VYGGAHLFRADSARKLGDLALRALDDYAPDARSFAEALGLDAALADTVYARVRAKLAREPVEDFRIDFEDGYGNRPDAEEDATAETAAVETARGMAAGTLPPFIGIRIKPLSRELERRAARTLERFLRTFVARAGPMLPAGFVVTLPKVMVPEQVEAGAALVASLESDLGLAPGAVKLELMVETPEAIVDGEGRCPLPTLVAAARGRCVAAHFGVYDYTAALGITAAHQHMRHPACDLARGIMQVALAGTGVWLSDGATTVMPVAPHRAEAGQSLTAGQRAANRAGVHHGWRLHFADVTHSLVHAFYQGWDLHPAQLPTRYAALYAFFLSSLDSASRRLARFVERAAQATLVGDVFDDAATGQGLLNFFLRGLNCGAISEREALATGLTLQELGSRSFLKILEERRGRES
jgi:citrate lyase beta subunit